MSTAPPRSWLLLGPWQARYGEHCGLPAAGAYRMLAVAADGGRASRVVAWPQIHDLAAVYQLSTDGSATPTGEAATFDGAVLSVRRPPAPGEPVPAAMPLALLTPGPDGWTVCLPIRLGDRDGLFYRVATIGPHPGPDRAPPQSVLAEVLERLPAYSRTAGSHECWYYKHDPDTEYEHKLTLDPGTDIYAVARAIADHIAGGELALYRPEYRNDFELWQFDNHLFEIRGPSESDRGYVSFIPRLNGGHTVKRKKFRHDGFRRHEQKTFWAATDVDRAEMEAYLADELALHASYLGSFERIRFDVMIENTDTGHIYSLVADRCIVHGHGAVLQQLEIEYIRSRGDRRDCETEIVAELDHLRTWVCRALTCHEISHETGYTSKYTFLRQIGGVAQ